MKHHQVVKLAQAQSRSCKLTKLDDSLHAWSCKAGLVNPICHAAHIVVHVPVLLLNCQMWITSPWGLALSVLYTDGEAAQTLGGNEEVIF